MRRRSTIPQPMPPWSAPKPRAGVQTSATRQSAAVLERIQGPSGPVTPSTTAPPAAWPRRERRRERQQQRDVPDHRRIERIGAGAAGNARVWLMPDRDQDADDHHRDRYGGLASASARQRRADDRAAVADEIDRRDAAQLLRSTLPRRPPSRAASATFASTPSPNVVASTNTAPGKQGRPAPTAVVCCGVVGRITRRPRGRAAMRACRC